MKTNFVPLSLSGSKTLYGLTALVIIAGVWAYLTPIDIAVSARGIVRPQGDPIRIVSETGGRIKKVQLEEGAIVRAGAVLLQLDTRDLLLKMRSLESRIHYSELQHTRNRDAARMAVENARIRFARADLLLHQGLIARQLHDDSRSALTQAEAEESRLSDNAELGTLYHDLEQTRLQLDRLTITSPAAGQITSLASLHAGEILGPGTAIAALVPRSHNLVIESWLPSSDRTYVIQGQVVRLQTDSFPADQYNGLEGTVLSISPDARFNESLSGTYRVLITPSPYSAELHLGQTFNVHFITRQQRLLWLLFDKVSAEFD
jgi:multidrug resistance efflux pump